MNQYVSPEEIEASIRKIQRENFLEDIKTLSKLLQIFKLILTDKKYARNFVEFLEDTILKEGVEE